MESPDEGVTIEQLVEALKQPIPPGTSGDPIFTIDPSGDIE
jgi:hypothetical protein